MRKLIVAFAACMLSGAALAQQQLPQDIPFEGGTLTIAAVDEVEKVLTFEGEELAREYVLYYDRTVEVSGRPVALFDVGDGGTACPSSVMLVWKAEDGQVRADTAGDDCGSPPASVSDGAISFVPYLMPGDTKPLQVWSPESGFRLAGMLSFSPQPGTKWADLKPQDMQLIIDIFANEAVYNQAKAMLGDEITQVATGLLVGGGVEPLSPGVFWSSGCIPHACGSFDAFMAFDIDRHRLYFAQVQDSAETKTWPVLKLWPKEVEDAARSAIAMPQ